MTKETGNRELVHRIDLLERDYKIMEVNIDATLNAMRADQNAMRADQNAMRTDIERNNSEAAKRETRLILVILGAVGVGVAILSFVLN